MNELKKKVENENVPFSGNLVIKTIREAAAGSLIIRRKLRPELHRYSLRSDFASCYVWWRLMAVEVEVDM